MSAAPSDNSAEVAVARYKTILQNVIGNRPSGTRQRLATALGKNRSFVSQIASPTYPTPIPARHVETIFDICHFSPDDRAHFLKAYNLAHPRRIASQGAERRPRGHMVYLPDLGDEDRNRELDRTVSEFVQRLSKLIEGS